MKKTIGIFILVLALAGAVGLIWYSVYADYRWNNEVYSNWMLSDKSSTLEAKASYMEKFVSALQSSNLADNDALIYKTANNNCANNIQAVSTLRDRLEQIKGMDESSFQYQQAIQQITSQEQGEADALTSTLNGCWMKTHYYYLWNPLTFIGGILGLIALLIVGGAVLFSDSF